MFVNYGTSTITWVQSNAALHYRAMGRQRMKMLDRIQDRLRAQKEGSLGKLTRDKETSSKPPSFHNGINMPGH